MGESIRVDRGIKSNRWRLEQVDCVSWDNEFSNDELELIINYCDQELYCHGLDKDYGGKKITFTNLGEILFIKERIIDIIQTINKEYFRFNISNAMFISYIKFEKDNYLPWHMDNVLWVDKNDDTSNIIFSPRKLTLILQLSDINEYTGGDLVLVSDSGEFIARKKKGLFNVFPGYMVHKVTPILSGTRRVLQVTCTGPNFK